MAQQLIELLLRMPNRLAEALGSVLSTDVRLLTATCI